MYNFCRCVGKKVALLVLPKGWLCVSGQNQMCHLCGWLKLFLKKCGGEKNKKHRVGLSVGLLAVPLQYGLYVFGHLSKWFVFVLKFKFWSVGRLWNGRPTIGYNISLHEGSFVSFGNIAYIFC